MAIDHICPLACCGLDAPQNMQWLTAEANRAKSNDCSACGWRGGEPRRRRSSILSITMTTTKVQAADAAVALFQQGFS
jgi:hypothetical protein